MRRRFTAIGLVLILTIISSVPVYSAPAPEEFYRGKVIRIIVGFSAGGGFDTYARALSRYMGKYVPGNPTIIVENMVGAGSLISANYIYRVAKPDGLAIGAFNGNQILGQLIGGQGISFDPRKMEWMGAPGYNHDLCVLNQKTGITSAEQWLAAKTPMRLGGSAPGATTDDTAKILKEAIHLPMRLITGYKGTADIRVAVESGEIDGLCGFSWVSVRATWRKAIDSGQVTILLQSNGKAHPELAQGTAFDFFCQERRSAPTDRNRSAPVEPGHLRLLIAAQHAEGSRAGLAASFYANRQRSRFFERRRQSQPGNRARCRRGDRPIDPQHVQNPIGCGR